MRVTEDGRPRLIEGTTIVLVMEGAIAPANGEDMTLIATLTASNSATLDFTGLSGGTKKYKAVGSLLVPATNDATLRLRMGTGAGPTYDTGNNYRYSGLVIGTGGFSTNFSGNAQASAQLHTGAGSAGTGAAFDITIAGARYTGSVSSAASDGNDYWLGIHGVWTGGAAFTALRFFMSAGNITSGSVSLYEFVD